MSFITQEAILPEVFLKTMPGPESGALATFFGIVRNHHEGKKVRQLHYECYPSMAQQQIERIKTRVTQRWELQEINILHRVGTLAVGEIAVAVSVASAHRAEAFAACSAVVDAIKHEVPIWKKEFYMDGTQAWVLCGHPAQEVHA